MKWCVEGLPFRFLRRTGIIGTAIGAAVFIALYNPASTAAHSGCVATAAEIPSSSRMTDFLVIQTKDPRPEILVAACAICGISLVDLVRQSKPHRYQELVFLAYFVAAAVLSILDCFYGSPIPSALRRVVPATMICGQLTNMAIGLVVAKEDEEQNALAEKVPAGEI